MGKKGTVDLETSRLFLKKMKLDYAKDAFEQWTQDEDVAKYVRWSTHKSIEETKEWIKGELNSMSDFSSYCWVMELKENGEIFGSLSAFWNEEEQRYEIGYNIAKKYWNNGYTTEAVKEILKYLSSEEDIHKFICMHAKKNPASGRVMQKAGFKYEKEAVYETFDGNQKFNCDVYYLDL